jgi:hypothetical protein
MVQGAGAFTAADVALLDEIAETILPETVDAWSRKAAKDRCVHGADGDRCYTEEQRQVFMDGVRQVNLASMRAHGVDFMTASAAQRLAVVEALDREQKAAMDARLPEPVNRAPAAARRTDEPAHYFRMMKELALLGFFTSEIGCTKALRYSRGAGPLRSVRSARARRPVLGRARVAAQISDRPAERFQIDNSLPIRRARAPRRS